MIKNTVEMKINYDYLLLSPHWPTGCDFWRVIISQMSSGIVQKVQVALVFEEPW